MNNQEQDHAFRTINGYLTWWGPLSEWTQQTWYSDVAQHREEASARAEEAVARASSRCYGTEAEYVVVPAELAEALCEVSDAPAVHALLALLRGGVASDFAQQLVLELSDLEYEANGDDTDPGWTHWHSAGRSLIWCTCTGATTVVLAPDGATLTRFDDEVVTGEWVWDASGVLAKGWVDPTDPRAGQLTRLLGVRDAR